MRKIANALRLKKGPRHIDRNLKMDYQILIIFGYEYPGHNWPFSINMSSKFICQTS